MMANQHPDRPTVVKVSEQSYAVKCLASASNPIGYTHVKVDKTQPTNLHCLTNECRGCQGATKQVKRKRSCVHMHSVILARRIKEGICQSEHEVVDREDEESIETKNRSNFLSIETELQSLSITRASTLLLQMQRSIPYLIPITVLKATDTRSYQKLPLPVFEPTDVECSLCRGKLGNKSVTSLKYNRG